MTRVVHFEIHAEQPERAMRFYRSVFEWEFIPFPGVEEDYWFIKTGEPGQTGIDGGLRHRDGPLDGTAITAFVCTVAVDKLDRYLMKVRASGGKLVTDKHPVPGIGWLAYAKDTEGNIFGLLQADEDAS
jgi:uncharacterized protein